METDIRYLELVRGDLLDAARRQTDRGRERTRAAGTIARRTRPLAVATVATLLVAGAIGWLVTTGGFSSDDSGGGDQVRGLATGETGGTAATGATGAPAPQATTAPDEDLGYGGDDVDVPAADALRVIRTAQMGLVIPRDAFDERFADAADVATAHGGFVQDSTTRQRSGDLTMRVPASDFGEALGDLREMGNVQFQRIEGRDVTAEYVDLRARLRIVKSRREVLLRLMDEATSIEQTIRVLNALDETQLRIEQIQGELNLLDDRTTLATISVSLREEGVEPAEDVEQASLPNAFERSVAGFIGVIAAVVVGLGYVIPMLVLGLATWLVWSRIQRRRSA